MPRLFVFFSLIFALCASSPLAAEDEWSGVERVVAIGDVHGDYGQFLTLLQQTGLTNEKGRWTGGKAHLVQTGDIPDRGPDTKKIMDLLMRLEKQSRKAGGYVHALIGNHDAMNLYGDLRYVTPDEFKAFASSNSSAVRDSFWKRHAEELRKAEESADEVVRKDWYEQYPLGYFEQRIAYGPKGAYGKWIRSHNAVIRVNDSLFLHGGVSPRLATGKLREINETIRKELDDRSLLKEGLTIASDGPLWYRGLAQGSEEELDALVNQALENYGVKRIVVGHTPTVGTVVPRFGGRVLMIDVGLSAAYGGRLACLVIEGDKLYAMHRGEKLEIPDGTREGILRYAKQAAELDPPPSPLLPFIQQLENPPAVTGQ